MIRFFNIEKRIKMVEYDGKIRRKLVGKIRGNTVSEDEVEVGYME